MKYDDTDYLINREESIEYKINLTKEQSIELLKSTLSKFEIRGEQLYLLKNAVENVLEEQKQKDKRIKELEAKLEFKQWGDLDNTQFEEYMSQFVPKQKVKDKIEELKLSGGSNGKDNVEDLARELVIEALEELLEEK